MLPWIRLRKGLVLQLVWSFSINTLDLGYSYFHSWWLAYVDGFLKNNLVYCKTPIDVVMKLATINRPDCDLHWKASCIRVFGASVFVTSKRTQRSNRSRLDNLGSYPFHRKPIVRSSTFTECWAIITLDFLAILPTLRYTVYYSILHTTKT